MVRRHSLPISIAVFTCAAAWAIAQPTADERERQRRLAELRMHPEQLARLRDHLKAFLDLPEKRRLAIAKLDQDLHDLPAKERKQLGDVLDRYADWLEQLRQKNPAAYQAIKDAPDAAARRALIKDQREREWMEAQPKKQRDEWAQLQGAARAQYVANLRAEARHRHEQWLIAKRFWKELEIKQPMPTRLGEFTDKGEKADKVKKYVDEYLLPYLTAEEKKALESAEGRWPDYPQALVAIASKYPSALPPSPPRNFSQLPTPVQNRLTEKKKGDAKKAAAIQKELQQSEGPHFATKVVSVNLRDKKLPFNNEYLAASYIALLPPMKEFMDKKLIPVLDSTEKQQLSENLGKWPAYPETIRDLAKKHELSPPWHILPDPQIWKWDQYRSSKARSWGADIVKDKKTP